MSISNIDPYGKRIIAAARAYIGVPFRHQGRSREGLDCLGLLVRVADDCGLQRGMRPLAEYDKTDYGHLPEETRLKSGIKRVLNEIEAPELAAVALFRIDGSARHLGLIGNYSAHGLSLIHAYAPAHKVTEHHLDKHWINAADSWWRLPKLICDRSAQWP